MRLILSGGGNSEDVVPIDKLFKNQIDIKKTVLYIPVAMEPSMFTYDECFEWFRNTYNNYGITNIELCTDLYSAVLSNKYTAVFIGGGNTFKLLKEIKDSHFDSKLIEYLKRGGLLYGGSAGAIICGKTIKAALHLDKNNVGITNLDGLNLLNGADVYCHYSVEADDFIRNYNGNLFALYEESGLFIQNKVISSIGRVFKLKSNFN
jgi:dipeptidase E